MRARRERGGVGKGARGVVQFRVGITLDFRGDVATSPALSSSTPPPSSAAFSGRLQRPPQPHDPLPPLLVPSLPPYLVFCHFSAKATHPSYYRERAPTQTLSGRDRSFRATLYTVHRREHIASDDIPLLSLSPSALSPDVAAGRPTDRRLARPVSRGSRKRGHYITLNIAFSPPRRPIAHLRRKIDLSGCT